MVTDSACSLPPELVAAHGIVVVPMWVTLGGRQYADGELSPADVAQRLSEGLSTSCPAPGQLAEAFDGADAGDGVVALTVSARMSGVFDAARLAAGLARPQVQVVDTGTAAGAEGLVVLAAARAAASGLCLEAVVAAARAAAANARLVATVPSLEHLARSGRVPAIAASGARWLGLAPLFEFRHGRAVPLRPGHGRQGALARMVAAWERDAKQRDRYAGEHLHLAGLHSMDRAAAEELVDRVSARLSPATSFIGDFSSVMVAHTGPGLAGLAWSWGP